MSAEQPLVAREAPKVSTVARPRRRLLRRTAAAVAAIAVLAIGWFASTAEKPVHYLTTPVTRGAVTRAVSATGTVNPVLTIIVGTYVSGVIQQLFCDFNTEVKQGQICAKIDPRPYQSVVDQDRANLDVAKAQLEKDRAGLTYAEVTWQRNAKLAVNNFASQEVADSAKSVYEQAKAQIALDQASIEQREAELAAALVNLGYTDITSPVNGTVVSRNVTQGQTVAATFQTPTLFLIATDLTKMEVDTNVSESDIGAVKEGGMGRFTVDAYANRVFQGVVAQVRQSPQTVQNVVTYDVVVNVDNGDHALMPGMTAAVQLVTAERRDVLRVPDQALRYRATAGQDRVWVLRDGRPVAVAVVKGLDDDTNTEIVNGELKPGDQLILGEQRTASAARSALPTPRM